MLCKTPHIELVPLLEKHGLPWDLYSRKGRLPKGLQWVAEKRRDIITELHLSGMSWARMIEVTGLSLGAIERGTRAMWNEASRQNRRDGMLRVCQSNVGRKMPWVTLNLQKAWAEGKFNFHRGRKRSREEKDLLKEIAARPENKQRRSVQFTNLWQQPEYRDALLAYHRSEEQRQIRSEAQTKRMAEHPEKWCCGIGAWVEPLRCTRPRIWTRSSFERKFVSLLDSHSEVDHYEFEPITRLPNGRWILPDFVVTWKDGHTSLIEVKPHYVLAQPLELKVSQRLCVAYQYSVTKGWAFQVWTEKGFEDVTRYTT